MKKLIPFSIILLLLISNSYSQNTFEISYGTPDYDIGASVQQTFDGKYIVAGTTYSDSTGNGDIYLALIDSIGNVIWTKFYGDSLDESGNCVIQASDSGFVIAGSTNSFGHGESDAYLVKTNQNGDTLWTKTYGGADFDYGYFVQNTFDGGFIVVGQESSTDTGGIAHISMIKTDSIGDTLWTRSYPMAAWTGATGIVQTPDSGYMVFGDFENNVTGNGEYDLVWMRTNSLGNLLSTKTFEDTMSHDYAISIRQNLDGGFILASQKEDVFTANTTTTIIRLDSNGDTIWVKSLGLSSNYSVGDIVQTTDSGFVSVGSTYDTATFISNLCLVKMNAAGDSLWGVKLDGLFSAGGNSIQTTSDGGFIACGVTADSTLGSPDVYVVKTDGNGAFVICQPLILSEPADTACLEGTDALFNTGTSPLTLTIQWQMDSAGVFVNLSDGGIYSGTNTETLMIDSVHLLMDGFQFRCIVTLDSICSDTSRIATLGVTDLGGISSVALEKNILYPNPAKKEIAVKGIVPESIIIYDVYGKIVARYTSVAELNISFLANGLYYAKLIYRNKEAVQKFIKN
jgi:hypothetical protein